MYVTIDGIKGEKRIDLSYPIRNFESSKEVAVVGLFSDNTQYELTKPWTIELNQMSKSIRLELCM